MSLGACEMHGAALVVVRGVDRRSCLDKALDLPRGEGSVSANIHVTADSCSETVARIFSSITPAPQKRRGEAGAR